MLLTLIFHMHIKKFLEWIGLKAKLDSEIRQTPYVSERQVWWASLGENVGFEINGKSKLFTRPVIIFRKLSSGLYFVIPLTTQPQQGTWYVKFKIGNVEQFACLHQARSIDYRRLYSNLGWLDEEDFRKVEAGFKKLYLRKIFPAISDGVAGNP